METKNIAWIVALVICCSTFACAAGTIKAGTYVNSTFSQADQFDVSENVYGKVNGVGNSGNVVNIYIVKDREWKHGDRLSDMEVVKTLTGVTVKNNDVVLLWSAPLKAGKYDIFVDNDQNGIYEVGNGNENDFVETHAVRAIGFEVLPELVTSVLLVAGLASMIVYTSIRKN